MLIALLVPLAIGAIAYLYLLARAAVRQRAAPLPEAVAVGAVANFFDTLGIGSFAPTLAWLNFRKIVPDRIVPQTMLVGHSFPAIVQAIIFLALLGVAVDPVLLTGCALATMIGGFFGVGMVNRSHVSRIKIIVGTGLILAAAFYIVSNLKLMPIGGTANSLPPLQTALAITICFGFGALINFGIGNFAPTLALLSLMGMDPRLCFPIMAGGAAFAAMTGGARHIRAGTADFRVATGLAIGGVPAVLLAAFVVKEMPVETLRWLVAAVVLYTGLAMLNAGIRSDDRIEPQP